MTIIKTPLPPAKHDHATAISPLTPQRAPAESLVSARGLGVRRDGRWLVRGVDLDGHAGEILTLIGRNGSGKSTTARSILGLLRPSTGRIERRAGLKVGYVPQHVQIDPALPLTVKRLMTLTMRHGAEQIDNALAAVGLEGKLEQAVQSLSGGEFQRALLARAIASNPDLLVLDEPVQGVDFTGEIQLYDLIQQIRQDTGCGVLLVSHDLHIVMAKTDSVVCLNGHVCCHGTPQMVAGDPAYINLFGRRGADALAVYRHDHDHLHLPDGQILPAHDHAHDHGHEHHHGHNAHD